MAPTSWDKPKISSETYERLQNGTLDHLFATIFYHSSPPMLEQTNMDQLTP